MSENNNNGKTLLIVALVFMILSCVSTALTALIYAVAPSILTEALSSYGDTSIIEASFSIGYIIGCLIPLAWQIPMTVVVGKKMKTGEQIGTGFKVCVLLFVNIIAGILLLCRQEDNNNNSGNTQQ